MDGLRHRGRRGPSPSPALTVRQDCNVNIQAVLLTISDEITDKQMKKMLFRLADVIPNRERDLMKEPYEIFEFLKQRGLVSDTSVDYLINLFTDLQFHNLSKKLKRFNLHRQGRQKAHKCIFVGKSFAGKTALCVRLKYSTFTENYDVTLDPDCFRLHIFVEDNSVPVHVWDTGGMEARSLYLPAQLFHGAAVVLIVFDITCQESFDNTTFCRDQIRALCDDDVIKFLIGNKSDLANDRKISEETARERAAQYGATYLEVSATNAETTENILREIGRALLSSNKILDQSNDDDDESRVSLSMDVSTQTHNINRGRSFTERVRSFCNC